MTAATKQQAELAALSGEQRALYNEALDCGATHNDAMEAAETLGYTRLAPSSGATEQADYDALDAEERETYRAARDAGASHRDALEASSVDDDEEDEDEDEDGPSELDVAVLLLQALEGLAEAHPDDLPGDLADLCEQLQGSRVETLAQGGFLTNDEGVALRLRDGSHFTISVGIYERGSR